MDRIDEGQLPDADCRCAESGHLNRSDIRYEQRDAIHIFDEGQLEKDVVVSKMEITTQHGAIEGKTQTSETTFYSLDAIIAVG